MRLSNHATSPSVMLLLATASAAAIYAATGPARPYRPPTITERVAEADAVVVGKVADVESKRFAFTLYEKGSDGGKAVMQVYYDLAVLRPDAVLKTDDEHIVDHPAGEGNGVGWIRAAYRTPRQKGPMIIDEDQYVASASRGEEGIWLLQRDHLLNRGQYFIVWKEPTKESTIQAIKKAVAEEQARERRAER
jgi:hypothetical protein